MKRYVTRTCPDCGEVKQVRGTSNHKKNSLCRRCSNIRTLPIRIAKHTLPGNEAAENKKVNSYRYAAKARGIEWLLSKMEALDIMSKNCFYCGSGPCMVARNYYHNGELGESIFICSGIDRIDNDGSYSVENCVPCCTSCNKAKLDKTTGEFIAWIKRVHAHLNL